jgi:hypothetical protein
LDPLDTADRIFAELAGWTRTSRDILGMSGPTMPRAWCPSGSHGDIAGLPVGSTGAEAGLFASWLLAQYDRIVREPFVVEMTSGTESFRAVVERAARTYPTEDSAKPLQGERCGRCHRLTVAFIPPADAGQEAIIKCLGCGEITDENHFDWSSRRILSGKEAADLRRAQFAAAAGQA